MNASAVHRLNTRKYLAGRLRQAGTHIRGRVTHEEMAKFWPSSDHPIAAPMNEIPKIVFSASLQSATWPPTRIARGDTAEELARLKQEPWRGDHRPRRNQVRAGARSRVVSNSPAVLPIS
jgi:hypothetical protein